MLLFGDTSRELLHVWVDSLELLVGEVEFGAPGELSPSNELSRLYSFLSVLS